MATRFFAILLLLHAPYIFAQNQGDEPDYKWSKHVIIGEKVEFNCNESNYIAPLESTDEIEWMLPDKPMTAKGTWSDDHRSLADLDQIKGAILRINDVQPSVFGYYSCRVYRPAQGKAYYTKYGLNLGGAPYEHLWDKYQYNLMIGGIAAAVVLVATTFICLVYKFRYKDLENERFRDASRYTGQPAKSAVYDNAAMETSQDSIFQNGEKASEATDTKM